MSSNYWHVVFNTYRQLRRVFRGFGHWRICWCGAHSKPALCPPTFDLNDQDHSLVHVNYSKPKWSNYSSHYSHYSFSTETIIQYLFGLLIKYVTTLSLSFDDMHYSTMSESSLIYKLCSFQQVVSTLSLKSQQKHAKLIFVVFRH